MEYTNDASACAPTRIFLKRARRPGESGFYTRVAPTLPDGVVPSCYFSRWDETTNGATLVFEDLSDFFDPPSPTTPPEDRQVSAVLKALAALHGTWWNHPHLDEIAHDDSSSRKAFVLETAFEQYPAFLARYGDSLDSDTLEALSAFFSSDYRQRFAERLARGPRTVIHGDAHVGQVMFARDGSAHIRVIDWEDWQAGIATDDAAFFLVMHPYRDWEPVRYKGFREDYFKALTKRVPSYTREQYDSDFAFSREGLLAWPVFWAMAFGSPEKKWRPILASAVRAQPSLATAGR